MEKAGRQSTMHTMAWQQAHVTWRFAGCTGKLQGKLPPVAAGARVRPSRLSCQLQLQEGPLWL